MIKKVPLVPFPLEIMRKFSGLFLGFGETFSHMFPSLPFDLDQAKTDIEPREWVSISLMSAGFYFILIFFIMYVVTNAAQIDRSRSLGVSFLAATCIAGAAFLYINMYPKLLSKKKVKDIESNLPFALNHLLIQIRSGVPLFNCLASLSRGEYGALSREFRYAIEQINTGKSELEMLEKIAMDNPSLYFRRVLWQIINAIKSGADIGITLRQIVENLSVDQTVAIKKYGSQLNPVALIYMIFCVVMPSLGITFLLVLGSLVGIGIKIEYLLLGILAFLVFFQFMLMGMIKSRRPIGI